jgi:site-specific DNA-methyltransferase (adenine-specific)
MSGFSLPFERDQVSLFTNESSGSREVELSQYFTPRWAAERLLATLGPLQPQDFLCDGHAGRGAWLHAVPEHIGAAGVEIDPELAAIARTDTGREIIVGDFARVELTFEPSHIVGNPPFTAHDIEATMRRCRELLTPGGKAGFIVPVHSFSFASKTLELLAGFDVSTDLLPRDLYPRISFALMFLRLTRTPTQRLTGFLLFNEALALRSMRSQYRAIAENGRKPIWREIVHMALTACGGEASLERIYDIVENYRPTPNRFWRDAIRREAGEHFERVRPGIFRLPTHGALACA